MPDQYIFVRVRKDIQDIWINFNLVKMLVAYCVATKYDVEGRFIKALRMI